MNATGASARKVSLRRRIWLTRLGYALTRFESAVTIAVIIVAVPAAWLLSSMHLLPESAWIAVLLTGMAAIVALVTSSMSDPKGGEGEVRAMLYAYYGIREIADETVRELVVKAIEYRIRMEDVLGGASRVIRSTMFDTVTAVDRWIAGIGRLVGQLDRLREDARFQVADKQQLRERIDDLARRVRDAADGKVRQQLCETIAGRKHQLRVIGELENLLESGELRLEHAVGALGTIYTQLTIYAAHGMDGGEAARLAGEISHEIDQVDSVLFAMDRVWNPTDGEPRPASRLQREPLPAREASV